MTNRFSKKAKEFFKPVAGKVRVRDVVRELPSSFNAMSQQTWRAFGGVASAVTRKPFTPTGTFQKELFGTDRPITPTSVGRETRFADPTKESKGVFKAIDPALGLTVGLLDAIPTGRQFKQGLGLTLKTLEKLKGAKAPKISKQYIQDLSNAPDLKQHERDLIRETLSEMEGDRVDLKDFTHKVTSKLLPLQRKFSDMNGPASSRPSTRFESVTLPDELRGPVANYSEHIYESPIKTSAGGVHFSSDANPNYFAHTRVEDLPDDKTRRAIEIQSDLFQKGRLEKEKVPFGGDVTYKGKTYQVTAVADGQVYLRDNTQSPPKQISVPDAEIVDASRAAEMTKLEPYRNTWWERVIREEVKHAAKDGKTKLQFPTGETAMKVEGLGDRSTWRVGRNIRGEFVPGRPLDDSTLVVGAEIFNGPQAGSPAWIITDVLGDGKFKAIPKRNLEVMNDYDLYQKVNEWGYYDGEADELKWDEIVKDDVMMKKLNDSNYTETFDISGKVDTNNPIYKFYEKEVGKYLSKRYRAQRIKDAQGIEWWEITVDPKSAKAPVEAFAGGAVGLEEDEEGKVKIDPLKAGLGIAAGSLINRFSKNVSQIDRLIAENKVRVVSRDGRDVYQIKKGSNWVNVRDEDSSIRQATKTKPQLPESIEQKKIAAEIAADELKTDPAKNLMKFVSRKTGRLPEVTGKGTMQALTGSGRVVENSKFGKSGDDLVTELGFEDTAAAQEAIDRYLRKRENLTALQKELAEELRNFRASRPKTAAASKPPAPKPAEVASLELSAQKALGAVDLPPNQKPLSLEKIVTQTPLVRKVNALDYLRTPDRVLKKIGFGEEAKLLRTQYEKYVKELPKNIDTITAWAKRVPKESNKRIFQFLDGEDIKLNPTEQQVATEIRAYLDNWADRLDLPKDKRVSHYITHLFEDQLIQKEFDEDLAKIIADKVPTQVYDPFLQKRLGAKGYKQDVWKALDAYTKRATRKVHMDPALKRIEGKAGASLEYSNIEESQFKYIKRYVDRVNLRPTEIDNLLDNTFKQVFGYRLGQRPALRILQGLRRMTYRGMLGLNLGSALRNLSQGINTYAVLGEKATIIGYSKLFSPAARRELKAQGVLEQNFIQDRAYSATKKALERLDKGVWFFFDTAEKINRGAAYLGAKSRGLSKGMSEEQAIEYAKSIVRKTQFQYDTVDTPLFLQPDVLKTLFQFQTFTTKQTEFLAELVKDRNFLGLVRYGLAGYVFVHTIGKAFGMEEKEILPTYRFGVPPSLKLPVEITKAVFDAPDKYGNDRDLGRKFEDVTKAATGLIPAGVQIKKTLEGISSVAEDGVFDRAGRKMFEQGDSTPEKARSILFGKYASPEADAYFDKKPSDKKKKKKNRFSR